MTGYRGYVVGPNGEHIATTTATPDQLAEGREREAARIAKAVDARKREEAEAKAARERALHELGAAALAEYEESCRQNVLRSGGTAADFARVWPDLKADYLKRRAAEGPAILERAKDELRERMRTAGLGL